MERRSPERTIAERMRRQMDDNMKRTLFGDGMTSTTPDPEDAALTPTKMREKVEEWDKLIRAARRNQMTVVVDIAHDGPALRHETPNDGWRIECSHRDAQRIHEHWPLKLHKVNSPEQAEFVPASGFGDFVTKILPPPPYDMPEEESFEERLSKPPH